MSWPGAPRFAVLASVAAAPLLGCAGAAARPPALEPRAQLQPSSVDRSAVCDSLAERFIGLPSNSDSNTGAKVAPSAGSWWVRSCSAIRTGDELRVRLQGPGWYWVEESSGGIAVRQQVPFQLSLEVDGRVHDSFSAGVFSLWFEPAREPRIQVVAPAQLNVRSSNALGWMLQLVPLASPGRVAAERFSESMTTALRGKLRDGATVTFDVRSGQSDAALGRLEAGEAPRHPFEDGASWVVNDRLFLAPAASQVLGPINPGRSSLDVAIESGSGVSYKALCSEDMISSYAAIASGELSLVPGRAWVASGEITGPGPHTAPLRVESCKFYLVVATTGRHGTLAALRVRG
jgi:hypothetical protein